MGNKAMRREWERNLAAYQIAAALADADASFGPFAKENLAFDVSKQELQQAYGSIDRATVDPEGRASWERVWSRMGEAEETRYRQVLTPMWQAAIRLAETPAPDLAAALTKIEIIKHEELDNDTSTTRDPFELVAEDMARISGEIGQ
ncbi:MAG TPA: hypothetical protein VF655_10045 [Allosphingosinicella sp.]|jgi:hypothetical protein